MTAINQDMTAAQTFLPLSAADVASLSPGFYTIDDENIVVAGPIVVAHRAARRVTRGVGGSAPESHSSGATLARYYPEAPGGEGGPGSTPDLDHVLGEGNDADGRRIRNLGNPEEAADAANRDYVDARGILVLQDEEHPWEPELETGPPWTISVEDDLGVRIFAAGEGTTGEDMPDFLAATPGQPEVEDGTVTWTFLGYAGEVPLAKIGKSIASSAGVLRSRRLLTAAQLMAGDPVELIPAQGDERAIIPIFAAGEYIHGDFAFDSSGISLVLMFGESTLGGALTFGGTFALVIGRPLQFDQGGSFQLANIRNAPLVVVPTVEPTGDIVTADAFGGIGFEAGDLISIDGAAEATGLTASFTVDTVDGGGAITSAHSVQPTAGWKVGWGGLVTGTNGSGTFPPGDEAGIGVTEINPLSDGQVRLEIAYFVMPVTGGPT